MSLKKTKFSLKEICIRDLFVKSDTSNPSYEIPLYQRNYSWGKEQIECLIDDIIMRSNDDDNHYFGIIAISNKLIDKHEGKTIKRVIDGQQRITTSILIIDWLINKIDKNHLQSNLSFVDKFPSVKFDNEISTETSNDINEILINDKNNRNIVSRVVKNNLKIIDEYIYSKTINTSKKEFYEKLLNAFLDKFFIGQLLYDISEKNEMLVFENLNSKGSPLSEYDLIKNLIISNGDIGSAKGNLNFFNTHINNLVASSRYWLKNENDIEKVIVSFFEKYIIFKTSKILNKFASYGIYKNLKILFKGEMENGTNDFKRWIYNIKKYFILYLELLPKSQFKSLNIRLLSSNPWFGITKKNIHIPLIFKLYERYSVFRNDQWENNDEIEKHIKEWTKFIMKLIAIEGTGQSLLSLIVELLCQVDSHNSIKEFKIILSKNEEKRAISMEKFRKRMLERSKNDWINKGVLDIIEYEYTKKTNSEITYRKKKSLEHIMPQKPKIPEWEISDIDMEIKFKDHINLIGNFGFLDIIKNSSASNNSFIKKKQNFYHNSISPLFTKSEILGISIKPIIDMNEWNFDTIKERTKSLVDIIYAIFQE